MPTQSVRRRAYAASNFAFLLEGVLQAHGCHGNGSHRLDSTAMRWWHGIQYPKQWHQRGRNSKSSFFSGPSENAKHVSPVTAFNPSHSTAEDLGPNGPAKPTRALLVMIRWGPATKPANFLRWEDPTLGSLAVLRWWYKVSSLFQCYF